MIDNGCISNKVAPVEARSACLCVRESHGEIKTNEHNCTEETYCGKKGSFYVYNIATKRVQFSLKTTIANLTLILYKSSNE